jgi:hypothetical protein
VRAEAVDHRLHAAREVRADAVHLVDVRDARDLVLVGLAPDGLRLRLDAGDGVEQRDGAVEDNNDDENNDDENNDDENNDDDEVTEANGFSKLSKISRI